MKCDICDKTMLFGNNVSHSKRHTRKQSMPNIHKIRAEVDGKAMRVKICTRCLRTQNKLARSAE
ncbi:MAG TPA: 50S ribosomal protein L28 [Dehalococcoidia bacterium]|nr:50S ribosomal protein L28 [Dehalococcoidia bacterium]HAS28104.1 50S ribosomal protein L28 [Dehalococcoidia bacterium]